MAGRTPLFLEGNRICDADGRTVMDLSPEQRQQALQMARLRLLLHEQGPPEADAQLSAILESARRRIERADPGALAELQSAARLAEYRRRAEKIVTARLAEIGDALPDSPTQRIPLTDG